ncbi:helix-turn-helix transcriptional regulator [Zymobacter palmae]|uniref:DNA-binding HTHdomain-containing proteins n=1 Tax=Zymobacter palmae TaxID=33074 RepID=A0A348HCV3_9GAMM|nr:LuxR family transcriptional regulator [Zymobacter palmae]BBG29455.1 DNA-binding HTHdomain-containing proteins [Zymobacter palmae]
MHNWRLDLFSGLDSAQDMHGVLDVALKVIRPFGFENCGWRALVPTAPIGRYTLLHSWEDSFVRKEHDGRYDDAPVPQHCAQSTDPISWQGTTEDPLFMKAPLLWEEYYECGHYGGWAQSLLSGEGNFSMLYMDSSHVLYPDDLLHVDTNLRWITAAVLCRMDEVKQSDSVRLAPVEHDILRWLCEGLDDEQIAKRMTTSVYLIHMHLRSAMVKLKASTRQAAVARAVFLGLL